MLETLSGEQTPNESVIVAINSLNKIQWLILHLTAKLKNRMFKLLASLVTFSTAIIIINRTTNSRSASKK